MVQDGKLFAFPNDGKYILVYDAFVPAAGSYTLTAAASSIFLGQVYPTHLGTTRDDLLTLTGAGFDFVSAVEVRDQVERTGRLCRSGLRFLHAAC